MKAVKVDDACRVRLPDLKPGDYYQVEGSDDRIVLTRLTAEDDPDSDRGVVLTRLKEGCSIRFGVNETGLTEDEFKQLIEAVNRTKSKHPAG